MDAVGFERAAVTAEGFAGLAAVMFAVRYPERIERLALRNSFAQLVAPENIEPTLATTIPLLLGQWGTGTLTRGTASSLAAGADPGFWGRTERLAASPKVAAAMFEAELRSDIRATLGEIAVPTLVWSTRVT